MTKQRIFLATNIKMLRRRKEWKQEDLALKLNITRSKLALVEAGKTTNLPLEDVINLSTTFGISVDTLLRVDLQNISELKMQELEAGNDTYATGTKIRILATTVDKDNREYIEFVPEKAKAGYRSGYSDPEWISGLPRYSIPGISRHRKNRIFPINGDSMLPYPDGCYIVGEYVEDWVKLKDGSLCILILKSGGTDFVFKQVENRIKQEKTLLAKSLNPIYQPYEIPVSDVLEIWMYRLHIANSIDQPSTDVSSDQLIRMMHEIKLDVAKLAMKAAK